MKGCYIIVFTCISLGYSFPLDLSQADLDRSIEGLIKHGMIVPDPSDMITGYAETAHGKMVFNNMFGEFTGNLLV